MIDYIRYPWVGDGSQVTQATGFRYRYDAAGALETFAKRRRSEGRRGRIA